jgi:hypothetical protein
MKSLHTRSLVALALVGATAFGAGAFGGKGPEFAAARNEAFTQADADGSGALSTDEFATFHEVLKAKLTAARFAHVDANGDGQVTAEELAEAKHGGCHGKDKD